MTLPIGLNVTFWVFGIAAVSESNEGFALVAAVPLLSLLIWLVADLVRLRGWIDEQNSALKDEIFTRAVTRPDNRDVTDERYQLWLINKYGIDKNRVLEKFIVSGDVFPTLTAAIQHADELEKKELESDRIAREAQVTALQNERRQLEEAQELAARQSAETKKHFRTFWPVYLVALSVGSVGLGMLVKVRIDNAQELQARRQEQLTLHRETLNQRFEAVEQGVSDQQRGIIWSTADNGESVNWVEADAYCSNLGNGWRLPSVAELKSLYDSDGIFTEQINRSSGLVEIERPLSTDFIEHTSTLYWTYERYRVGFSQAWRVNLRSGVANRGNPYWSSNYRALCVRRLMTPWREELTRRFKKVEHGVLDLNLDIIWAPRNNESALFSLSDQDDVRRLNARSYCSRLGDGWRLPSVEELKAFFDVDGAFTRVITSSGGFSHTIKPATQLIHLTKPSFWTSEASYGISLVDGGKVRNPHGALCVREATSPHLQ